jgi:ribonuclease P/MRP protein subunit POP5
MSQVSPIYYVPHLSANLETPGTIKHAQLAAIEHNRKVIARYRARAKTPG